MEDDSCERNKSEEFLFFRGSKWKRIDTPFYEPSLDEKRREKSSYLRQEMKMRAHFVLSEIFLNFDESVHFKRIVLVDSSVHLPSIFSVRISDYLVNKTEDKNKKESDDENKESFEYIRKMKSSMRKRKSDLEELFEDFLIQLKQLQEKTITLRNDFIKPIENGSSSGGETSIRPYLPIITFNKIFEKCPISLHHKSFYFLLERSLIRKKTKSGRVTIGTDEDYRYSQFLYHLRCFCRIIQGYQNDKFSLNEMLDSLHTLWRQRRRDDLFDDFVKKAEYRCGIPLTNLIQENLYYWKTINVFVMELFNSHISNRHFPPKTQKLIRNLNESMKNGLEWFDISKKTINEFLKLQSFIDHLRELKNCGNGVTKVFQKSIIRPILLSQFSFRDFQNDNERANPNFAIFSDVIVLKNKEEGEQENKKYTVIFFQFDMFFVNVDRKDRKKRNKGEKKKKRFRFSSRVNVNETFGIFRSVLTDSIRSEEEEEEEEEAMYDEVLIKFEKKNPRLSKKIVDDEEGLLVLKFGNVEKRNRFVNLYLRPMRMIKSRAETFSKLLEHAHVGFHW